MVKAFARRILLKKAISLSKSAKRFHWSDIECLQIINVLEIKLKENRYVKETGVNQ